MIIKEILQDRNFKDKHILKIILKKILGLKNNEIYIKRDKEINDGNFNEIQKIYKNYENDNIPIEYLIGETEFMDKKVFVNKNVLIPRPETEYLVQYAYNFWKKNKDFEIFDIGTGSGIIGNSLSRLTEKKIICSDISEKALNVAKYNNKNGENIFLVVNLGKHLKNYKGNLLICANLPYLEEKYELDNFAKKEPSIALFSGENGLKLYLKLLKQIRDIKNGKIVCFWEMTKKQGEILNKEYKLNGKLNETCHKNIIIFSFEL